MPESQLLQQIAKKESDKDAIASKVIKNPELLSQIIDGLGADKARIKYGYRGFDRSRDMFSRDPTRMHLVLRYDTCLHSFARIFLAYASACLALCAVMPDNISERS